MKRIAMPLLILSLVTVYFLRASQNMTSQSTDIQSIVGRLKSPDKRIRAAASSDLSRLEQRQLTPEECVQLLEGAASEFPEGSYYPRLLVSTHASAALIPTIVRLYPQFSRVSRWFALMLLAKLDCREATEAIMEIVRRHARNELVLGIPNQLNVQDQHVVDQLFPELLDYLDVEAEGFNLSVCQICIRCLEHETMSSDLLAANTRTLVTLCRSQVDIVTNGDLTKRADALSGALTLLELLGYLRSTHTLVLLKEMTVSNNDLRLVCCAAASLVRLGVTVDDEYLERIAKSPLTRNWLYDRLALIGRSDVFPETFKTQEAFAESSVVHWLAFPTELGQQPDEIRLMEVIDVSENDERLQYYVFQFRSSQPPWAAEKGWMAAMAGPYVIDDVSTDGMWTFSAYERWSEKTPEEHVAHMRAVLHSWEQIPKD